MTPQILLVLAVFLPFVTASAIYAFGKFPRMREAASFVGALLSLGVFVKILSGFVGGFTPAVKVFEILPNAGLAFEATGFGLVYAGLASVLWVVTLLYAHGYLRANNSQNLTRFYSFFAIAIGCALGMAFSANLLTMFIFYELMTLSTYPLVAHNEDEEAKLGARKYLSILLGASIMLFLPAIVLVYHLTGSTDFVSGGLLVAHGVSGKVVLLLAVLFGFGVTKAALMPLHKWLPAAMVAPTPVSALLHAVAVVKAGVFCLSKIMLFTLGAAAFDGGINPILFVAVVTLLLASITAISKNNLKQRLAYSTVAQLSYIVVASCVLAPLSLVAAGLHMVAHGVAKITLFFCAGAFATTTGKKYVSELDGVGRQLPIVSAAFFVASLSMIGLPLIAGGISKHYIVEAAEQVQLGWVMWVFYASMVLNAMYYLPISYRLFVKQGKVKLLQAMPKTMVVAIAFTVLLTLAYGAYYSEILELLALYE